MQDETPNDWLVGPPGELVIFLSDQMVSLTLFERGVNALKLVPSLAVASLKTLRIEAPHLEPDLKQLYENAMEGMSLAEHFQPRAVTAWRRQVFVSLWSAVESTVEQVLINHLLKVPGAIDLVCGVTARMQKRRRDLTDLDGARVFVRQWEREIGNSSAVERMKVMLSAFGIVLGFDEETQKHLTELCEARNIILHRHSLIDGDFKNKVPWSTYDIGDEYEISAELVLAVYTAAHSVARGLLQQIEESPWFVRRPSSQ